MPVKEQWFQKRDEIYFIVNLYSFSLPPVSQEIPSFPKVGYLILPMQNHFRNFPSSRHFDNSLSVHLVFKFEPQLGKSEFNNLGMKKTKLLEAILILLPKNNKKQTVFVLNFLETPVKVSRGASVLYLNAFFFCYLLFFEDISTLRLLESTTKWLCEYHPCP